MIKFINVEIYINDKVYYENMIFFIRPKLIHLGSTSCYVIKIIQKSTISFYSHCFHVC